MGGESLVMTCCITTLALSVFAQCQRFSKPSIQNDLAICNLISLIQHFPGNAFARLDYFNNASSTDQSQLIGKAAFLTFWLLTL